MNLWERLWRREPRQRDPTEEELTERRRQAEKFSTAMTRAMRDVLRGGRLSGDGVGWNWSPLSFEQRRNQKAHQIDFTTLKNYSAAELLEILVSTHPDISDAVWQFLRLGDTPFSFAVRKRSGKEDSAGQRALEEEINALGAPHFGTGFEMSGGIGTAHLQVLLMILVRGAMCLEVEPAPNLRGVQAIHVIDAADMEFRKDPDGRLVPWQHVERVPRVIPDGQRHLWQGNYKRLDSPTIVWEALDPFPGDPYGREPLLPVLQVVFFEIQFLRDLQAVVHNQGYPRLEVEVLMDVIMKRVQQFQPHLLSDPNPEPLQKFLEAELQTIASVYESLEPDDTITHYDNSKLHAVGVEGKGPMIDVSKLIGIIESRIATGCKTFLTMLSRHTGTAEGARSTDAMIYQKSVAGIQKVAARGWGRALTVALNLLGRQGTVEFTYEAPDLRTPDQQEKDFGARRTNARNLFDDGLLDESGYYQYVFDRAPDADTIQRMQEKLKPKPPRGGEGA